MAGIYHIKSISELHRMLGCSPPRHPSISLVKFLDMKLNEKDIDFKGATVDFYVISMKNSSGQIKYGKGYYDFEEGTMLFAAPNQIMYPSHLSSEVLDSEGWSLFVHPDLLYGTDLGKKMGEYSFFSYDTDEALHLSEIEKIKILSCVNNIVEEYNQNIDAHSKHLIVSNLELLLNYCRRFYDRQFLTRGKQNKSVVVRIERLLIDYFNSEKPLNLGLPTVKYCAEEIGLSPNYLSDLLKKETGKNTKEHIDYYLLERGKNLLLSSDQNISQVAYDLGFEDPKSFSKLFKKKVGVTPNDFRSSVN
ncbi:helix-turn-helix domain-containing protein [Aureibacter tunicatorum]|uniref:AraC-like DNA-binding protein n=1 Tax=Aureibacter tunicatorum TaxID=866807 RepID=A0AAE3XMH0_9BACT|nr:AraC family transcriptional regulator [Aureibacter tunicatorum]MDR6239657.1 AraC-like DNA-binding protein [Aureibacter tunicatorum]BDD04133.1 AraC family transcriptional regulator [Aureibacter tunicatorum]